MKQIINLKKYDTDTATVIFETKFDKLYQKRNGEYFLCDIDRGIIPFDDTEAKEWCAERMGVDKYEQIFGECPE